MGLHQGSALSPFLFVNLLDVLTEDLQLDLPWDIVYADDVMIGMVVTQELNLKFEAWREKLEERGLRISRVKTESIWCPFGVEDEQEVDLEIDFEVLKETQIF